MTIRTNESTHILHDPEYSDPCFAAKVKFFPHVQYGYLLWCSDNQSPVHAGIRCPRCIPSLSKKSEYTEMFITCPRGVSITKKSNSSQSTSLINCFIMPFFLGPRQIIGVFGVGNKNDVDINDKLSRT